MYEVMYDAMSREIADRSEQYAALVDLTEPVRDEEEAAWLDTLGTRTADWVMLPANWSMLLDHMAVWLVDQLGGREREWASGRDLDEVARSIAEWAGEHRDQGAYAVATGVVTQPGRRFDPRVVPYLAAHLADRFHGLGAWLVDQLAEQVATVLTQPGPRGTRYRGAVAALVTGGW